MKALIVIDYTHDFVASDGALTTGIAGQKIETALIKLTETFIDNGEYVVFAVDSHESNDVCHPEHRLFPPHNILGSAGQKLYGALYDLYQKHRQNNRVYYLSKRRYSAFCGTDLDIRLRERGITELHLSGVCTDICILHTAIEAYHLGYDVIIHENAVAGFDSMGHQWALNHMNNVLGAKIKTLETQ